ncbi:hypothetical protein EV561_1744 [Rhizobium sp. BK376]|nr:hypothetical protein EV561_1744 [Rhizobium sp. BK376]
MGTGQVTIIQELNHWVVVVVEATATNREVFTDGTHADSAGQAFRLGVRVTRALAGAKLIRVNDPKSKYHHY